MTVKELIEKLTTMPSEAEVFVWDGRHEEWREVQDVDQWRMISDLMELSPDDKTPAVEIT